MCQDSLLRTLKYKYLVNNKKLTKIYKSLIKSKIKYSFLPLLVTNKANVKKMEAIQNNALRIILNEDCNYGNAKLRTDLNSVSITERTKILAKNWFIKTSSDLKHPVSIIKHQYKYFPEYDSRITLFEI